MSLRLTARLIRKNSKRNDRIEALGAPASCELKFGAGIVSSQQNCTVSLCPQEAGAPSELAAACGIPIKYETLPLAFGRVIYLAEASLQPPSITVNTTAIAKLTEAALLAPVEHRKWFTEVALAEVFIAHELFHILTQQPSGKAAEALAHEFAQRLTGLPFSPHVYEAVLKQAAGCRTTKNII